MRRFNFCPAEGFEVEDPKVIHICNAFSTEDDEVWEDEFGNVVGSFPRRGFVLLGCDFDPFFGGPVEDADGIETLLI